MLLRVFQGSASLSQELQSCTFTIPISTPQRGTTWHHSGRESCARIWAQNGATSLTIKGPLARRLLPANSKAYEPMIDVNELLDRIEEIVLEQAWQVLAVLESEGSIIIASLCNDAVGFTHRAPI